MALNIPKLRLLARAVNKIFNGWWEKKRGRAAALLGMCVASESQPLPPPLAQR